MCESTCLADEEAEETCSEKMLHRLLPLEGSGHLRSPWLGVLHGGPLPEQCVEPSVTAKIVLPIASLFLQLLFCLSGVFAFAVAWC